MRYLVLTLLILVAVILEAAGADSGLPGERCAGIWAAASKAPYAEPDFSPTNIFAPNGKFSVNATSEGLSLVKKGGRATDLDILVNPPLMEVLWAPDSRNFVINVSDGGLVGSWDVKFYSIDEDERPVLQHVEKLIRQISSNLLDCDPKEEANIGAVSWLKHGKEILIVVEVPPHSSCRNMGAIFGFRVSVKSGKIIERISEDDLRKKWANVLGCRFMKRV